MDKKTYDILRKTYDKSDWVKIINNEIPQNCRLVLWGAGFLGKRIYKQISEEKNNIIIAWVDKKYAEISDTEMMISDPEEVFGYKSLDFDYVIICIESPRSSSEVNDYLSKRGINSNKIVILRQYDYSDLPDIFQDNLQSETPKTWNEMHETEGIINLRGPYITTSMICNQEFLDMPFAQYWRAAFREKGQFYNRKLWERTFIVQALYERGFLRQGNAGIGFGVGQEFLPDFFASYGINVLATDLGFEDASERGWVSTGQHSMGNLEKMRKRHICDDAAFFRHVSYKDVNMNEIPDDIRGYDFCWSTCALEHLGGLRKGAEFIVNSMKTLREGGVAVHTTEYNIFSNEDTIDEENLCLFRKRDMIDISEELLEKGYHVEPFDWYTGGAIYDDFIDIPPYLPEDVNLRILVDKYPCTPIGIIVYK